MFMLGRIHGGAAAAVAVAAVAIGAPAAAVFAHPSRDHARLPGSPMAHVLLVSVDGLHQSDVEWYVSNHPGSELAKLVGGGAEYAQAHTPIPSDSFPGMTAQVTGGNPRTTGIYYDDEYSHAVLPAGTTSCHGQPTGGEVIYDSPDDNNATALDAGQGLTGLPGSILEMTDQPQSLLNPAALPVNPRTCKPIYPHEYLQVNTIFEVAHDHGLRTAWSDKHPAYEILDGPSGNGVDDLFTPEIDSNALEPSGTPYPGEINWTEDNAATMQYDSYKVQAVLNEIDGYDHSHTTKVGVPAIFGMNFQTVSTAEKLHTSDGLGGGYEPGTTTPGPLLQRALDYVNSKLQAMDEEIQAQGLADSTAIVVSAKHGQSPQDPSSLVKIKDGPIIEAINGAWEAAHSGAGALIVAGTDDDAWQSYLSNTSQQAADFVKDYLWSHTATGVAYDGSTRTLAHSGLAEVFAGRAAAKYFGVPRSDPRHPDVWGVVQVGVVYTGGSKIAEHGGANPADRDVPIVVYAPGAVEPGVSDRWVETTQIAPTILDLLGLDPNALQAVQIEGTQALPGIARH
ncbi:MAG TPA: alkaline phosphatase family protein [Solirubrobacteraceae bacterium]|nr:alkaline phosphatase family protein [Solirubrobacteraceae bacterium]